MLTDLYIRDKANGKIHRIGDSQHDSMWVDMYGVVHYLNLQNGDGASGDGENENNGYEFVESDCGALNIEQKNKMPKIVKWVQIFGTKCVLLYIKKLI